MAKVPKDLRKALYSYMDKSEEQKTDDLIKSAFKDGYSNSSQSTLKK